MISHTHFFFKEDQ